MRLVVHDNFTTSAEDRKPFSSSSFESFTSQTSRGRICSSFVSPLSIPFSVVFYVKVLLRGLPLHLGKLLLLVLRKLVELSLDYQNFPTNLVDFFLFIFLIQRLVLNQAGAQGTQNPTTSDTVELISGNQVQPQPQLKSPRHYTINDGSSGIHPTLNNRAHEELDSDSPIKRYVSLFY